MDSFWTKVRWVGAVGPIWFFLNQKFFLNVKNFLDKKDFFKRKKNYEQNFMNKILRTKVCKQNFFLKFFFRKFFSNKIFFRTFFLEQIFFWTEIIFSSKNAFFDPKTRWFNQKFITFVLKILWFGSSAPNVDETTHADDGLTGIDNYFPL